MSKRVENLVGGGLLSFGSQGVGLMVACMTGSIVVGYIVMLCGLGCGLKMVQK